MTDLNVNFNFENKVRRCKIFIDSSEKPYYLFVVLLDAELIDLFGSDISITTDFNTCLPRKDDSRVELVGLREAIFNAVVTLPEFMAVKQNLIY